MNGERENENVDSEFIINKAGGKVYKDVSKHNILEIPILKNETEQGIVYEVLSVGFMGRNPIITIKTEGSPEVYRLPQDLLEWCQSCGGMAIQGVKLFPGKVEFGQLSKRNYAELL